MNVKRIALLCAITMIASLMISCISSEDMGKFDILKLARDQKVKEF